MIRFTLCAAALFSAIVNVAVLATAAEAERPPNVVLFLIDDLGWTDLGFMGSRFYESPNIDRLAREGMKFMSAYANAPNCAPSRACLMSGQYTPRHGIYTVGDPVRGNHAFRKLQPSPNKTVLAPEFITIAEALQQAGYVTAHMGKWHLGKDPTSQGFDVNIAGREWGSPSGGGYHSPLRYPNLVVGEPGEYLTDRLSEEACDFIEKNKDRPFFLHLSHYSVHTPIQAKKEVEAKFKEKQPAGGHRNPAYAAMVQSVDDSVGRVLSKLASLNLDPNTVVCFFSDNGGHAGVTSNRPLRGGKGMLYEGGIREPMLVKWPGVTGAGTVCHEPVIGVDFFPTLLEITGAPRPDGYTLDGESLVPLLRDPSAKLQRSAIFWHFPCYLQAYRNTESPFRTTPAGAIRKGEWKLLEFFEDSRVELYNTKEDIGEEVDLAEKMPAKTKELHDELVAWRKKVRAPVPTQPNPRYDPNAKWPPEKKTSRRALKEKKQKK